jgi:hypothetical protein
MLTRAPLKLAPEYFEPIRLCNCHCANFNPQAASAFVNEARVLGDQVVTNSQNTPPGSESYAATVYSTEARSLARHAR